MTILAIKIYLKGEASSTAVHMLNAAFQTGGVLESLQIHEYYSPNIRTGGYLYQTIGDEIVIVPDEALIQDLLPTDEFTIPVVIDCVYSRTKTVNSMVETFAESHPKITVHSIQFDPDYVVLNASSKEKSRVKYHIPDDLMPINHLFENQFKRRFDFAGLRREKLQALLDRRIKANHLFPVRQLADFGDTVQMYHAVRLFDCFDKNEISLRDKLNAIYTHQGKLSDNKQHPKVCEYYSVELFRRCVRLFENSPLKEPLNTLSGLLDREENKQLKAMLRWHSLRFMVDLWDETLSVAAKLDRIEQFYKGTVTTEKKNVMLSCSSEVLAHTIGAMVSLGVAAACIFGMIMLSSMAQAALIPVIFAICYAIYSDIVRACIDFAKKRLDRKHHFFVTDSQQTRAVKTIQEVAVNSLQPDVIVEVPSSWA